MTYFYSNNNNNNNNLYPTILAYQDSRHWWSWLCNNSAFIPPAQLDGTIVGRVVGLVGNCWIKGLLLKKKKNPPTDIWSIYFIYYLQNLSLYIRHIKEMYKRGWIPNKNNKQKTNVVKYNGENKIGRGLEMHLRYHPNFPNLAPSRCCTTTTSIPNLWSCWLGLVGVRPQ